MKHKLLIIKVLGFSAQWNCVSSSHAGKKKNSEAGAAVTYLSCSNLEIESNLVISIVNSSAF